MNRKPLAGVSQRREKKLKRIIMSKAIVKNSEA
jgi:hypothetical protein